MSYDLEVYAVRTLSLAGLRSLIESAGLGCEEGGESGQAVTVSEMPSANTA